MFSTLLVADHAPRSRRSALLLEQRVQRHREEAGRRSRGSPGSRRAPAKVSTATRNSEVTPMPIEPIGTRPSSTLSPDSRPAATLPMPMPIATDVPEHAGPRSLECQHLRAEEQDIAICSSAPRNQNQVLPSTVSQSRRSRFTRHDRADAVADRIPAELGAALGRRRARRCRSSPAVPTTAIAISMRAEHPRPIAAHAWNRKPPSAVPTMIARNVLISMQRVGAREVLVGQHLRQARILGRREEGRMHRHQEDDDQHQRHAARA